MPVTDLPASPEAILANRSLYTPTEPAKPEQVLAFWDGIHSARGSEVGLADSVESTLRYYGPELEERLGLTQEEALAFSSLEWWLHQRSDELAESEKWISRSGFSAVSGMWGGLILKREADLILNNATSNPQALSGHLVLPEALDGTPGMHRSPGNYSDRVGTDFTYIGNMGYGFAERVEAGSRTTLYGSAGRHVASYAGRLRPQSGQPTVTIYGDTAGGAAHCAESLNLRITGDTGEQLARHAGGELGTNARVLIRVDGSAGKGVAEQARGNINISVGSIVSLGDISGLGLELATRSSIEVGPHQPGRGNQVVYRAP